jgi:hypothetical protein
MLYTRILVNSDFPPKKQSALQFVFFKYYTYYQLNDKNIRDIMLI